MRTLHCSSGLRWLFALALLAGAVGLHAGMGPSYVTALSIWFFAALGIGLALRRRWALPLAALPWPLGIGLDLATERHASLGEAWQVAALTSLLIGLGGVALGVAAVRKWSHQRG